jgi:lipid-A-disaccharide synthase
MNYYIIAGEASGDLHGSNLIKELKSQDAHAVVRCWGGDLMQAAGGVLVKHYRDLAFMGFVEVLKNLSVILKNLRFCREDIQQFKPDALILIDYPGFNLRIAEWAHQQGIRVIYYISPQVWAWKENRVKKMKLCIDLMLVILPFEKDYYRQKWHWEVQYVGHPLVEVVDQELAKAPDTPLAEKPVIALLPGSRKQEILKKLPVMISVAPHFPEYQFVVAQAPGQESSVYQELLGKTGNVSLLNNKTYSLLRQARAALVTSGTATLETALFGVPEVVCYKGSAISYQIARRLIKVKYISLVNLIMDRLVVRELIQDELNTGNLRKELQALLTNGEQLSRMRGDYHQLHEKLSLGGHASANAAEKILAFLQKN